MCATWLLQGKSDAKKAKIYSKVGKKIIQYVKSGGPDPVTNAKLDTLIKQAKDLGVPRDIIDRNIKRATDAKQVLICPLNVCAVVSWAVSPKPDTRTSPSMAAGRFLRAMLRGVRLWWHRVHH